MIQSFSFFPVSSVQNLCNSFIFIKSIYSVEHKISVNIKCNTSFFSSPASPLGGRFYNSACPCVHVFVTNSYLENYSKTSWRTSFKGCTRSYKVVILNILNIFFRLDIVCTTYAKVKLMVCCTRFHTLLRQYISLLSIFGLSFALDAPKI